jgi:hypothetical protein
MARVLRLSAWLALAVLIVVTAGPISLRPVSGFPIPIERFLAFLSAGGLFGLAYPRHRARSILIVVAFALGLELAQHLVPQRHGLLGDALVKAAGGVLGVLIGSYVASMKGLLTRP